MEGFTFRFVVAAILTICLFGLTAAQNSPQDYIAGHNAARAAVGVGQMVWDPTVAAFAQSYVNSHAGDCQMVHSTGSGYGENLFWGSAGKEWSASDAVGLWVAEKQWYNYGTNTCAAGKVCGHYTQVVWRNSVKLGCGRVKCANGAILISCNYSPPGNFIGQKPY